MAENPRSRAVTSVLRPNQTLPSVAPSARTVRLAPVVEEVLELPEEVDAELQGSVGNWTLMEKLGQGGMSVVYRAQHEWLNLEAAIKFLHPHAEEAGFTKAKERFYQEAYILSQFQHPNIVAIQDFGIDEVHGAYIVLELLGGMELYDFMHEAPLPLSWVEAIFLQISDALHALHERHCIHRDLKPSNVYVSRSSGSLSVKLLDFGVAKTVGNEEYKKLTTTGRIVGTPKYIAPEQLRTPELVSPLTDLYALGAMIYEALTGTTPHSHPDIVEYLLQITQKAAPPLGRHRPEFSGSRLEALLARLLSIDPLSRPSSTREFQEEFQEAVAALEDPLAHPEFEHRLRGLLDTPLAAKEQTKRPPRQIASWSKHNPKSTRSSGDQMLAPAKKTLARGRFVRVLVALVALGLVVSLGLGRDTWLPKSAPAPKSAVIAQSSPLDKWAEDGQVAYQKGDYREATRMWQKVIAHPDWAKSKYHPKLYWATGVGFQQLSKESEALEMFLRYKAEVKKLQETLAALKMHDVDRALVRDLQSKLPKRNIFQAESDKIDELQKYMQSRQLARQKSMQGLLLKFREAQHALGKGRIKKAKARLKDLLQEANASRLPQGKALLVQNLSAQAQHWLRQMDAMYALYNTLPRLSRRAHFDKFESQRRKLEAMAEGQALPQTWQKKMHAWTQANQRGLRLLSRASNAYALSQWRTALDSYRLFSKRFPEAAQAAFLRKRQKACRCVVRKLPWETCRPSDYPKHFKGKQE